MDLKLKEELNWVQKLADGLRTLKPKQFNYHDFITKYNEDCGTVCCAYGWMPKFVPEAGVRWEWCNGVFTDEYFSVNLLPHEIFHLIDTDLQHFMFYGEKPSTYVFTSFVNNQDIDCGINGKDQNLYCTLEQVINRIELVIKYLKENNANITRE